MQKKKEKEKPTANNFLGNHGISKGVRGKKGGKIVKIEKVNGGGEATNTSKQFRKTRGVRQQRKIICQTKTALQLHSLIKGSLFFFASFLSFLSFRTDNGVTLLFFCPLVHQVSL